MKEISPSVGYLADENEYDLVCNYEGDHLVLRSNVIVIHWNR